MNSTASPGPGEPGAVPPPPGGPGPVPPPGGPFVPPPGGPPLPPHDGGSAFFDSLRRSGLARSSDRWIGGVAGGIAQRLGVDPLIVRGVFVVLALFGGIAVVLYGLAWALLPEAKDGRIHLQEAIRGRFDAALAGAAAFVVVGLARPVFWFDPDRWVPGWLLGLAWLGLLVTVIVVGLTVASSSHRSGPPPVAPPFPPHQNGATPMSPSSPPGGPTPYPAPYPSDTLQPGAPSTATYPGAPATATYPGAATYPAPAASYTPPAAFLPAAGSPAPAPVWQPQPPRPRTPGPGSTTVAIVFALALFAGAAVLLAHRAGVLTGSVMLTVVGSAIVILGLGALVSGVRGRRAGGLAGAAVVLAVLAVPAAVVTTALPDMPSGLFDDGTVIAGDIVWDPETVAEAESGFSYAVGEARIDLTGPSWPTDPADGPATVRVEAGAGSTTIVVPTAVPLEVRTILGAGEVHSVLAGDWTRSFGPDVSPDAAATIDPDSTPTRISRSEVQGTDLDVVLRSPAPGDLALVVTIDAGIGDVTIEEEIA